MCNHKTLKLLKSNSNVGHLSNKDLLQKLTQKLYVTIEWEQFFIYKSLIYNDNKVTQQLPTSKSTIDFKMVFLHVKLFKMKRLCKEQKEQVTQNDLFRPRKNVRFTASLPKMVIFEQLHLEQKNLNRISIKRERLKGSLTKGIKKK